MSRPDLKPIDGLESLYAELRALIAASRQRLSSSVNAELSQLYWMVGRRLSTEVLMGKRARYGGQLMRSLGEKLTAEFGRGFEVQNLRRMVQFVQVFPDLEIVASMMRQLSWTHFLQLLPVKADAARQYYARHAILESWSVRELRRQIERKSFERANSPIRPYCWDDLPPRIHLPLSLKTHTFWISWGSIRATTRRIWRLRYCCSCKLLSWNWDADLPLWREKNVWS